MDKKAIIVYNNRYLESVDVPVTGWFTPGDRMQTSYQHSSAITGQLQPNKVVTFKNSLTKQQRWTLAGFMIIILITSSAFVTYLLGTMAFTHFSPLLICSVSLLVLLEIIRLLQSLTLAFFANVAKDPIPMRPKSDLRVAILTTIVPSKEPFPLVARTLKAMKEITPTPGAKIDVWLLDEGNQPAIRKRCDNMGVKYFSRQGLEGWNTSTGPFKARTKHGNHNAWRRANEHRYDIVAQMDPDHVPRADFLERTLGYFSDPAVGFVVAPQVYGNLKENWIARGAAFQAYIFHGIIQRGGNGLQAPLLIGTNHLYRVKAFQEINGYQDSIIEDHLTSMVLFGTKDSNGRTWKGVYTPDIVAVGEGPTSFTDYFNQQKRWAYGIWEIATKATPHYTRQMTRRQALTFVMLQFFYPSVAVSWILSSLATLLFSFAEVGYHGVTSVVAVLWLYSIASSMSLFFWLRRFNLVEHERKSWGLGGMALMLMCIPVYVSAAVAALARRPLTYAVTAKGDLTSPDSWRTFRPHFIWLLINACGLTLLFGLDHRSISTNDFWIGEHLAICLAPIAIYGLGRLVGAYHSTARSVSQLRKVSGWRLGTSNYLRKEAHS